MTQAQVLVVEDDASLLEDICTILELKGYNVVAASCGQQALDYLHQTADLPDLIVSDIMMPNVDGMQLLQAVREVAAWVHIPFIFLTARDQKSDVWSAKRLGVDDYLMKPFDPDDLMVAIEARLMRKAALVTAQSDAMVALKRNILTILNHEFRTPLTFVVAYADLLKSYQDAPVPQEELSAFLRGIGTGASRLRCLIENFIFLVDLETGEAQRTYEWRKAPLMDYHALLQTSCDHTFQVENARREVVFEIVPDLPPIVTDDIFLKIAIAQLISNAMKFSPPDTPIFLGANCADEGVCLWVKDHGRGIPADQLADIWSLFVQVNRPFHEDQGTGSGLAIVRGIVDLHGGRVDIQSEVGAGTCVMICLPFA